MRCALPLRAGGDGHVAQHSRGELAQPQPQRGLADDGRLRDTGAAQLARAARGAHRRARAAAAGRQRAARLDGDDARRVGELLLARRRRRPRTGSATLPVSQVYFTFFPGTCQPVACLKPYTAYLIHIIVNCRNLLHEVEDQDVVFCRKTSPLKPLPVDGRSDGRPKDVFYSRTAYIVHSPV